MYQLFTLKSCLNMIVTENVIHYFGNGYKGDMTKFANSEGIRKPIQWRPLVMDTPMFI